MPAALLAMTVAALIVKVLNLERIGVKIIGPIPAGLPPLRLPHLPSTLVPSVLAEAAGVTLISFSSMMLTARSFASKNRYDISLAAFAALGVAKIASAVSQGFAVSGADSRTAVNDAAGWRTQMAGFMAAAVMAAVLMFFTGPLPYAPTLHLALCWCKPPLSLTDPRHWRRHVPLIHARADWKGLGRA